MHSSILQIISFPQVLPALSLRDNTRLGFYANKIGDTLQREKI